MAYGKNAHSCEPLNSMLIHLREFAIIAKWQHRANSYTAKTSVNILTLYDVYLEQQIININRCSI